MIKKPNYLTFGRAVSRVVSAALHIPNCGGPHCHRGPKIQSRHHLAPQRKLRSRNWNMKH